MSMKWKYIFILCFLQQSLYALEVDSFTNRYDPVEDSLEKVDKYLNDKIKKAVAEANHADEIFGGICHYQTLRRKVKKQLVANLRGVFVSAPLQIYVDKGRLGQGYSIKTSKSEWVYQYVPLIYKPILKLAPLSPLVLTNNALIGSDKFSHLLNLGYIYYRRMEHNLSSKEILDFAKKAERVTWGGFFNGIVSNADLVANFQGLRFYMHLFGKGIDPLTGNDLSEQAAIKCVRGKFEQVRQVSLAPFIDDALDEGINCNSYTSKLMIKSINKHLNNIGMQCPVSINRCKELGKKYTKYAKYLLHPECR